MKRMLRVWVVAAVTALLGILVVVEAVFVPYEKPRFPWHRLPGYAALIGLGACVVVVLASKALGRMILQRRERPDD